MIGMKKSMKGKMFFAAAALALFSLAPIFGQEQNDAAPSEAQAQENSAANTSGGFQNLFLHSLKFHIVEIYPAKND